jgi:hypothetical protein
MDVDEINQLIDEGRTTVVRGLRELADRIEALPAADLDAWLLRLEPTIATVRDWAARAGGASKA